MKFHQQSIIWILRQLKYFLNWEAGCVNSIQFSDLSFCSVHLFPAKNNSCFFNLPLSVRGMYYLSVNKFVNHNELEPNCFPICSFGHQPCFFLHPVWEPFMAHRLLTLVLEESQTTRPELTSYAIWANHEKLRLVGAQWVLFLHSVLIQIKPNQTRQNFPNWRSNFGAE